MSIVGYSYVVMGVEDSGWDIWGWDVSGGWGGLVIVMDWVKGREYREVGLFGVNK